MRIHSVASWTRLLILGVVFVSAAEAQQGTKDGQWRSYGGDKGSTKYAPLDQIDGDNFGDLEVAWQWESIAGYPIGSTATGELVGKLDLMGAGAAGRVSGAPMTYMHKGKQFVVVALTGARGAAQLVALALP